jgi:hypothetical protein
MRLAAAFLLAAALPAVDVGHEYRQDDWPSVAVAPDGAVWVAFLSFDGRRDDIGLRRWKDGKWGALQWVPATSGDNWMPQVAADAAGRIWVVWSQQVDGNWDVYARSFDPAAQRWSTTERLTADPLPDIHPRVASRGDAVVVTWQGFRGRHSSIFLRRMEGGVWKPEVRVTRTAANDWSPAIALDSRGHAWLAYDSYRGGNYDVYLTRVRGDAVDTEIAAATSPLFEARASVAVDTRDRVWIAWEAGPPNWGKDQGYIIRDRPSGALLDGQRAPRVRCFEGGRWLQPPHPEALDNGKSNAPQLVSDGRGSVWLAAKLRRDANPPEGTRDGYIPHYQRGYWEYLIAHLDADGWSSPRTLPQSRGRLSTRLAAAALPDGKLAVAWPGDTRSEGHLNRPLRQSVYADFLPVPPPGEARLFEPKPETVRLVPSHANEAADIAAIRNYAIDYQGKKLRIVRGDFHRHTELSWDVGGGFDGSLEDFYRYMIDAAGMDFGASTDHQGGLWPYWWWYTQKLTDLFHVPGAYTAIYGYERSAQFPNGHRNVFFARRSDARVTPFFLKTDAAGFSLPRTPVGDEPSGTGELVDNDTKMLYEDVRGLNALIISHTSANRMGTDWRDNDPLLEPVVEIFQGCRTSSEAVGAPYVAKLPDDAAQIKVAGYFPEGMVANAWSKGYRLGVIASSDHFSTHISYAMAYTADTSRQGILDAFRRRHTYGATDNIILEVRMGAHLMGDEFEAKRSLPLRIRARGTARIAALSVIRDNQVVYSASPNAAVIDTNHLDVAARSGRHFYYVRLLQEDGMIAWSSPIFVNYR